MKKPSLCAVALVTVLTTALSAQTITGIWQGTLPGANPTRIVLTIEKKDDGSLHGGVSWIDRGAGGIALTSVTFSGPDLTFTQLYGDIAYRGKLTPDGHSIEGTWTQGNESNPVTFKFATPDTLWKHEGPAAPPPMAANADPTFDVATIKPTQGPSPVIFNLRARKFTAQGVSAKELIKIAYNLRGRQVLGGPSWLEETKFDIAAKPDTPGLPSEDQNRTMVRKLLAERFHLVCHTSQQTFPVFALTLDPKGTRPTPSDPDFNGHGSVYVKQQEGDYLLQFAGNTIPQFLNTLMNFYQDRQLVDETGLTGSYDIALKVPAAAFQSTPGSGPEDERGQALFSATEKAGFKFVPKKEPLPVIVVDYIAPPTPN
jgi:uncharacterized protein (TIGR03435 family)